MDLGLRGLPSFLSVGHDSGGASLSLGPPQRRPPPRPLACPVQVPAEVALPPAWLPSTLRPHRRGGSHLGSGGERAPQVPAEEEGTPGGAWCTPSPAGPGAFISAASAGPHVA